MPTDPEVVAAVLGTAAPVVAAREGRGLRRGDDNYLVSFEAPT